MTRVLIADDHALFRAGLRQFLVDALPAAEIGEAASGNEVLTCLQRKGWDMLILDINMPDRSGLDILKGILTESKDTIVVVMTGNPSVTSSIEALRMGAWDYLPKPFSATHLHVLIGRASHAVMVSRETRELRLQLQQQHGNSDKFALIGIAPAFRKAVELARKVAPTDASVLISGESGTGKEVIAQLIHQSSRRASNA